MRTKLKGIFQELDQRIDRLNTARRAEGLLVLAQAEVRLLGQMSLLANEKVSALLTLVATADLDALLTMDAVVKQMLTELLQKRGLVYDEDSYLIWIPQGASFEPLYKFKNLVVTLIDPESALVSKAVKAPAKNKQLIREAIATGHFPGLLDRIIAADGKLDLFAEK